MNHSTLMFTLLGSFFVLNLLIGLWYGRNVTSMRDYALANKSLGVGPLSITYLATIVGGAWVVLRPKEIAEFGIGIVYAVLSWSISFALQARFLAPRMLRFKSCLSLGDVFGSLYGTSSNLLAGVLSVVFNCVIVGMNVSFIGAIAARYVGISEGMGILICVSILTLYTAFGGMRAVTATDIFQFIFLCATLLILLSLVVKKIGGIEILIQKIPKQKLDFGSNEKIFYYLSLILTDIFFLKNPLATVHFERSLMAPSEYQLKKVLYRVGLIMACIIIIIAVISFGAIIIYPDIDKSNIFFYLIENLCPEWLEGFLVLGLLAIIFSTADSCLHSAGVGFSRNVVKILSKKTEISDKDELRWAKWGATCAGIFSIWFALYGRNLFRPDVFLSIVSPTLAAPMLFGILGLKADKKSFWVSAVAANVALIICRTADPRFYPCLNGMALFFSCCVSAVAYIITHITINDGLYYYTNPDDDDRNAKVWEPNFNQIYNQKIKPFFNFAERCRQKVITYGKPAYVSFGVVYLLAVSMPYLLGVEEPEQYTSLFIVLRFVAIVVCALLITESIWPDVMHRYLPMFWYFALIYCLPFLSTVFILLTNGASVHMLSVVVATMTLVALVDWFSAISIGALGIGAAVLFCKYYVYKNFDTTTGQELSFHTLYSLAAQLSCSAIVALIFMRKKQDLLDLVRMRNTSLIVKNRTTQRDLEAIMSIEDRIAQGLGMREINMVSRVRELEVLCTTLIDLAPAKDREALATQCLEANKTLKFLENLAERSRDYLKLNVGSMSLDDFVGGVDATAKHSILYKRYSIVISTDAQEIECDAAKINQVIGNILYDIFELNVRDELVTIKISETELVYKLSSLPLYEKKVKAFQFTISTVDFLGKNLFPASYKEQYIDPKNIRKLADDKLSKLTNMRILAAHFGFLREIDKKENGFTAIFVIPQKVRQIRPAPLDLEIPADVEGSKSWPGSLELETTLQDAIRRKSPSTNMHKVDEAIAVIKKYHAHQFRKLTGEPYYLHPLNVALILLDFRHEEEAILGALMHDLLEDTAFTIIDIKTVFGDRVADIVAGVSKIGADLKFHNNEEHLMTLEGKDPIILTIKIADRIHNMRTISGHKDPNKRLEVARETMEFFVPLAKKLGLNGAYEELKRLCEEVL